MKPPLSRAPLLPVLITLVAGILVERYVPTVAGTVLMCATAIVSLAAIKRHTYIAVITMASAAGYTCGFLASPPATIPRGTIHSGTILKISEATMSSRAIVELPGHRKCYLTIPARLDSPEPGDVITFHGEIKPPTNRRDVDTDVSLKPFLYRNYINITCAADSLVINSRSKSLKWRLRDFREHIIDIIVGSATSDGSKELLCAMLAGDTSLIPGNTRDQMSKAGLSHILAISGLHTAIIAGILGLLLWPLSIAGMNHLRSMILILALWLYAMATGLSPSVTRAVIMITTVLIGKIIGRGSSTFNSLCLAAILIIAFDPRVIYAPGFQLTMGAVASICLLSNVLPPVTSKSAWRRGIIAWIVVTVGATIGTSLLTIYHFHCFPIYFIIANIPVAFIIPQLLATGIILTILGAIGVNFYLLNQAIDTMSEGIFKISELTASLPGGITENIYISTPGVIAGYMALLAILAVIYFRKRTLMPVAAALILVTVISTHGERRPEAELFLSRDREATTVVVADGERIMTKSTSRLENDDPAKTVQLRHPEFFIRRKSAAAMAVKGHAAGRGWSADGRIVAFGDHTLAIVNSNGDIRPAPVAIEYVIIGQGFTGDINDIIESIRPDTVLIGTDVHPRRRVKFIEALTECNQAFRSLSEDYGLYLSL